jgi:preprotein translocase subunit SecG
MFGGGGDALFNTASGTSFIKKFTTGAAIIFAVTSLLLTVFSSSARMRSVVQQYPLGAPPAGQAAPAQAPAAAPNAVQTHQPAKTAPLDAPVKK